MLKRIVDSLDDIPEEHRGFYEERDGKFHLTLDVEVSEDDKKRVAEAARKEREARATAEKELKEAREKLSAFGDLTPEDLEELKKAKEAAAEAERKRQEETAKSREEWQALIDAERTNGEKKVKDAVTPLQGELLELRAVLDHLVLSTALSKAAAELPVKPSFVPLFLARAREMAKIERPSNGAGPSVEVAGKTIPVPEVVVYVDVIPVPFRGRPPSSAQPCWLPSVPTLPTRFQLPTCFSNALVEV